MINLEAAKPTLERVVQSFIEAGNSITEATHLRHRRVLRLGRKYLTRALFSLNSIQLGGRQITSIVHPRALRAIRDIRRAQRVAASVSFDELAKPDSSLAQGLKQLTSLVKELHPVNVSTVLLQKKTADAKPDDALRFIGCDLASPIPLVRAEVRIGTDEATLLAYEESDVLGKDIALTKEFLEVLRKKVLENGLRVPHFTIATALEEKIPQAVLAEARWTPRVAGKPPAPVLALALV